MWHISFDHISDHIGSNFKISYPGVAQLVARLVWDQDAAGSNPVTRTKRPLISCEIRGFYIIWGFFFDYSGADYDSILLQQLFPKWKQLLKSGSEIQIFIICFSLLLKAILVF